MPTNIEMPQMGESIFEGTITKWFKKEGDHVKRDEDLFEISTDKVDSPIPSPVAGVVQKILMPVGSKVPIHTVVAVIEEAAGAPVLTARPAATVPPASAPRPVVPAQVAAAPANGGEAAERRVFASPLVRRIARQEGVDIAQLEGSGWKGRITKKDIDDHLSRGGPAAAAPAAAAAPPVAPAPVSALRPAAPAPSAGAAPAVGSGERVRVVPMTNMQVKVAEHMTMSRRTSAHVTTVFEVDMTRVVEIRESERANYETVFGAKLTYTHFLAAAAVQALKEFPLFNASVDGTNIVYKSDINLGVAVAVPEGLIVPVVRNCEEKSFLGIVRGINDVAERAKVKKLTLNDLQGGTFTLTNPGSLGGLFATPIINQPQLAILGAGGIHKRPVVVSSSAGDAIAIRSMVYLDLSFDHRAINGVDAERFMARVKDILQTWTIPIK
ncbi:MAG TPA: dihydrolipoamide acetyltransferase family protein [Planctomycetota bacterium]|nr:dihydrolipoamide acetyltransferase family protein [Planctomycetota bacterium]